MKRLSRFRLATVQVFFYDAINIWRALLFTDAHGRQGQQLRKEQDSFLYKYMHQMIWMIRKKSWRMRFYSYSLLSFPLSTDSFDFFSIFLYSFCKFCWVFFVVLLFQVSFSVHLLEKTKQKHKWWLRWLDLGGSYALRLHWDYVMCMCEWAKTAVVFSLDQQ